MEAVFTSYIPIRLTYLVMAVSHNLHISDCNTTLYNENLAEIVTL